MHYLLVIAYILISSYFYDFTDLMEVILIDTFVKSYVYEGKQISFKKDRKIEEIGSRMSKTLKEILGTQRNTQITTQTVN